MAYKITIPYKEYSTWQCFVDWASDFPRLGCFQDHFNNTYLGITCEVIYNPSVVRRDIDFTFESEQHYHWFLLQQ